MRIKKGVKLAGARPELLIGLLVADSILPLYGQECVITSCMDGKHKRQSAHNTGRAADLRIWDLKTPLVAIKVLSEALGDEFDAILESDHIHLEWDPK